MEGLSLRHPERRGDFLLRDIDMTVCRGEVLGIFGLMGAGRTELLETIFGLHPAGAAGDVYVGGNRVVIRSPKEAIGLGLALSPEDRKREGLVLEMSVAENTSLASLPSVARWGFINEREEMEHVEGAVRRFRVKTPSLRTPIISLSGGNQQKVILAKWLATRPRVLLLDEPTRGIDINAKREIYGLIDELKGSGLAVAMVSSELPEIMAVADRIMVMCEGRKSAGFCAGRRRRRRSCMRRCRKADRSNRPSPPPEWKDFGMMRLNKSSLARLQPLIALAAMVVTIALLSNGFLTAENGWNILRQIAVNLCLSIGMTIIILTGGIDLSVGAVLALSGAIAAGLLKHGLALPYFDLLLQFTVFGAILAGVVVGLALGAFNGIAVTRFDLPPFIATLGMFSIARGLTMLWTGGFPITNLGAGFGFMGTGRALGIPMPVWISGALAAVFVVITRKTRFGRYIFAVGGNERAAKLSGLNVNGTKMWVYMLGGGLAGVAGLLNAARLDGADPNAGLGYELDSIAAVVIGGTSLSGGRGSIAGTVIGCLIIGVLNNGLALLNVPPFWQQVVKGFVILLAVGIDKMGSRRK